MVWHWKPPQNVFILVLISFLIQFPSFSYANSVKFKKGQLIIKNIKISVEIALSENQLKMGLMNRSKLDKESGMFFIYDQEQYLRFWMKNTNIPLSIAFINKEKTIVDIQDMEPVVGPIKDANIKRYRSTKPSMYALEMNKGWFKTKGIDVGDRVNILSAIP